MWTGAIHVGTPRWRWSVVGVGAVGCALACGFPDVTYDTPGDGSTRHDAIDPGLDPPDAPGGGSGWLGSSGSTGGSGSGGASGAGAEPAGSAASGAGAQSGLSAGSSGMGASGGSGGINGSRDDAGPDATVPHSGSSGSSGSGSGGSSGSGSGGGTGSGSGHPGGSGSGSGSGSASGASSGGGSGSGSGSSSGGASGSSSGVGSSGSGKDAGGGGNCSCSPAQMYPSGLGDCSVLALGNLGLLCSSQPSGFVGADPGCGHRGAFVTCVPGLALPPLPVTCMARQEGTRVQMCR
jgi:hypothetical protein